jgi:hypothetical protein
LNIKVELLVGSYFFGSRRIGSHSEKRQKAPYPPGRVANFLPTKAGLPKVNASSCQFIEQRLGSFKPARQTLR